VLNTVILFYKTHSQQSPILEKNHTKKHAFCPIFRPAPFIFTSILSTNSPFCTFLPFYLRANSPFFTTPKKQRLEYKKYLFEQFFSKKTSIISAFIRSKTSS